MKHNLENIEKRIGDACRRSGRRRQDITLIAVSKTKPVSVLKEAYDLGIRVFGENKAQELNDKYEQLASDIQWHMLGHLQRNKIKYIIDKTSLLHSLDSVRLAEAIEAEAAKRNLIVPVLVEVNAAKEASKFGIYPEDVLAFVKAVALMPHLSVRGLMTIAPYTENPEENRIFFQCLHKLLVDIRDKNIDNVTMSILSMGMTNDYEVAIEEGATMVRIGTGIFGERGFTY